MSKHRLEARGTKVKSKLYTHMREVGIDNFTIHLIERKDVADRDEMRQLEDKYIRELNTINEGLNGNHAYLTDDEVKEYRQQYYERNKGQIQQRHKQYHQQYYEANKQKIQQQHKQYHQQHYENNKTTGKYRCEACDYNAGKSSHLRKHERTQSHRRMLSTTTN